MAQKTSPTVNTLSLATEQMGRNWPKRLAELTKKSRNYVYNAVRDQRLDAPIWDAVEILKKERQDFLKSNEKKIKRAFKITQNA